MGHPIWIGLVAVVLALIIGLTGAVVLSGFENSVPTPAATAPTPAGPTTFVNLTITYDPATGMANYTTPSVSMVAHTLVVVTITNYDTMAGALLVPWDNQVIGTVGDSELVNYGSNPYRVTSLPAHDISHTFTVLDAFYNISVPIPPAVSPLAPVVVTFELTLSQPETTSWGCMCECGNGVMGARMYGQLVISG